MPYPLRLLLVDDSEPFLTALTASLADMPQLAIVGIARSAHEAFSQVMQLQPHVVVMDIAMPGLNGLEATRHIKAQPQAPSVVILTMYDNAEYRVAAAAAGADGFVNKVGCDDTLPALLAKLRPESPGTGSGTNTQPSCGRAV
jgi:DNA-binding NarL/FixJ family response regulator